MPDADARPASRKGRPKLRPEDARTERLPEVRGTPGEAKEIREGLAARGEVYADTVRRLLLEHVRGPR